MSASFSFNSLAKVFRTTGLAKSLKLLMNMLALVLLISLSAIPKLNIVWSKFDSDFNTDRTSNFLVNKG